MKHIKTYKIFENLSQDILGNISSQSYIIEDEGYQIVYFVTFSYLVKNKDGSFKNDTYTYALGSTDDIDKKIKSQGNFGLEDGNNIAHLTKVSLEIVDGIPKNKHWEEILREINEDGLFDYFLGKFKLVFPNYLVYKSVGNTPPYIYI